MVSFQKSEIVSVTGGGLFVVFEKQRIEIRRDLRRAHPFVNGEVPRMLALFAAIDQPDVDPAAVCIDAKSAAVTKFLFLPAAPAATVYPDRRNVTFHVPVPTPSSGG